MKLQQVAEQCMASIMHVKRAMLRDNNDRPGDPVIEAWRAGSLVATVFVEDAPVDRLDRLLWAVGTGMRADTLAYSVETMACTSPYNPDTGQPWEPGDLGRYYDKHGSTQIVHDQLLVQAVNSAGDLYTLGQQIQINETAFGGLALELGPERIEFDSQDKNMHINGHLTMTMLEAMNHTAKMAQFVVQMSKDADLTTLEATVLADWYAVQQFGKMGCTAALTTDDLDYAKTLKSLTDEEMDDSFKVAYERAKQKNEQS